MQEYKDLELLSHLSEGSALVAFGENRSKSEFLSQFMGLVADKRVLIITSYLTYDKLSKSKECADSFKLSMDNSHHEKSVLFYEELLSNADTFNIIKAFSPDILVIDRIEMLIPNFSEKQELSLILNHLIASTSNCSKLYLSSMLSDETLSYMKELLTLSATSVFKFQTDYLPDSLSYCLKILPGDEAGGYLASKVTNSESRQIIFLKKRSVLAKMQDFFHKKGIAVFVISPQKMLREKLKTVASFYSSEQPSVLLLMDLWDLELFANYSAVPFYVYGAVTAAEEALFTYFFSNYPSIEVIVSESEVIKEFNRINYLKCDKNSLSLFVEELLRSESLSIEVDDVIKQYNISYGSLYLTLGMLVRKSHLEIDEFGYSEVKIKLVEDYENKLNPTIERLLPFIRNILKMSKVDDGVMQLNLIQFANEIEESYSNVMRSFRLLIINHIIELEDLSYAIVFRNKLSIGELELIDRLSESLYSAVLTAKENYNNFYSMLTTSYCQTAQLFSILGGRRACTKCEVCQGNGVSSPLTFTPIDEQDVKELQAVVTENLAELSSYDFIALLLGIETPLIKSTNLKKHKAYGFFATKSYDDILNLFL